MYDFFEQTRAVVVDVNVFNTFSPLKYDGATIFTTQAMIDSVAKMFPNLLMKRGDFRRAFTRKYRGREPIQLEKFEFALQYMAGYDRRRFNEIDESFLVNSLRAAVFFLDAGGYIADEKDELEPFADGILEERRRLEPFLPFVPKQFVSGCVKDYMHLPVERRVATIGEIYYSILKRKDYAIQLQNFGNGDLKRLQSYVRHFVMHGVSDLNGFDDDVNLVALACAIPAKKVVVLSDDSDVISLINFANACLGNTRIIVGRSARLGERLGRD